MKTEKRSILFTVYKSNDYASNVYNSTSARLHITIEKVSCTRRIVVWSKSFHPKLLREYPARDNAAMQKVTVPDVQTGKEYLEIIYTLIYNSNGRELEVQHTPIIPQDLNDKVYIGI